MFKWIAQDCNLCRSLGCLALAAIGVALVVAVGATVAWVFDFDVLVGVVIAPAVLLAVCALLLYPFKVSSAMRDKMSGTSVVHFTAAANRNGIERLAAGKTDVCVNASRGYRNLGNAIIGQAAFFFMSEPTGFQYFMNLCGRDAKSTTARVVIRVEDLPNVIYWRIWDGAILIPNGYQGPGEFIVH